MMLGRFLCCGAIIILLIGCGGHSHSVHAELVFKGQVVKVEYILTRGVTMVTDAEGKVTELKGHPGIPCAELEVYQHGDHEYQIFQQAKPR